MLGLHIALVAYGGSRLHDEIQFLQSCTSEVLVELLVYLHRSVTDHILLVPNQYITTGSDSII